MRSTSLPECDNCVRIVDLFHFCGKVDVRTGDEMHLVLAVMVVVDECLVGGYEQRVLSSGTY